MCVCIYIYIYIYIYNIYIWEIIASHMQAYLFCDLYTAIKENPHMTRSIFFINSVIVEINLPLT